MPVVKETSIMARESAKACNIFSQWSREFGDQIHNDGITFDMTMYKIDDLYSRFRENGLPKYWLPPSIAPLLKVIVIDFKKRTGWFYKKKHFPNNLFQMFHK